MLDIKFIRENIEVVKENCKNRNVKVDLDKLLQLDEKRRELQKKIDDLRASRNQGSKTKPTPEEIETMKRVGEEIKTLETTLSEVENDYKNVLIQIPNMTHPDSPVGGEEDFKIVYKSDNGVPEFSFSPKKHDEILESLELIDFDRGAKVVGSKFYYSKNDLVLLNQALINYGMQVATKHGYELVETPDMAKHEMLVGAGFNPRGEEKQIYNIEDEGLSLIGTAEITMLGYHADEVVDLDNGPKRYAALSHCYRTESGAYGRTSKGIYRVHQFTKLELFIFSKPEDSEKLHQELLDIEKEICDGLGLSYRVIEIPTGDLGGPAYRKYDIEAWMSMVGDNGGYGEVTSTSNCTDYQARRLNIKYKNENGEKEFVHTLNGTAVVLSRFPLSIVEQYQQEDGSVKVPDALVPFMGKSVIKKQ